MFSYSKPLEIIVAAARLVRWQSAKSREAEIAVLRKDLLLLRNNAFLLLQFLNPVELTRIPQELLLNRSKII